MLMDRHAAQLPELREVVVAPVQGEAEESPFHVTATFHNDFKATVVLPSDVSYGQAVAALVNLLL
jgi:hypothetical protein